MKSVQMIKYADKEKKLPGVVAMVESEKPSPGPEEILIKVAYASICGSDAHVVRGNLSEGLEQLIKSMLPWKMGHEISGVIEEVGEVAAAMGFKPGDRVTANYTHYCNSCYFCHTGQENFCTNPRPHFDGMAEYVSWHMSQVHKIPDNVSLLHASQTEPLSIALNACQTVGVHFGSRVLISGAGPIGLYALQLAKKAGASTIIVSDVVESKHAISMKLGATGTVNPMEPDWKEKAMAFTDGLGFDAVLECSGASSAAQAMPSIMTKNGHCVMFAMYNPDFEMKIKPYFTFYEESKHIHGMYTSADAFPKTVAMLSEIQFDDIIEGVFEPEQCEEAFEKVLSGKYIKLIFKFSDDK
ncbi:MAG: zinc-dependent alcohol dehydrogenase [Candidatus Alectryocaccobium sp.]|jgi:threonine dehydrogenase-like Zn-dependent dehydrogenase